MEQARRDILASQAKLDTAYNMFDDIEPHLRKSLPEGFRDTTKTLYTAFGTVSDVLRCLDYFLARMAELDMTPEQALAEWDKHQPADFLDTMRDWQSYGPNEINLVDEFILKPMGLPPCPENQGDEDSTDG